MDVRGILLTCEDVDWIGTSGEMSCLMNLLVP
jgi:hypothetical protein